MGRINPSLNKQVNHVNLTLLTLLIYRVKYPYFFYHCIFQCPTFTLLFSIHTSYLALDPPRQISADLNKAKDVLAAIQEIVLA